MNIVTQDSQVLYIEHGTAKVPFWDVVEILGELEDTSYGFGLVIYDQGIIDLLLDKGVVSQSIRGHVYEKEGGNRKSFLDSLLAMRCRQGEDGE